ncbi:PRC-barrel domain containing protein [Palleronia sediminis]|uniref:PRC-barrel domain containing protein n=1 Tax=Palleronia sediminis TaxID=2547833 RepID=A0A4R6ADK9_9RHOB|nr:PRC-barrel domain-containing protein [Palleronia sediminis]TDL79496.1 PRC-barrel domain containing protein [Palleronia sediminis]
MQRITSTALALVLATGTAAFAQDATDDTQMTDGDMMADEQMTDGDMMNDSAASMTASADMMGMRDQLIRSRDLTGSPIYTINEADDEGWDPELTYDTVGADWNQIGEIEDLVLDHNGDLKGIVAEVGGFLDIGDKHVMISVDDLNLVAADSYAYVTRMNEEELESMEGVDEGFWQ